VDVLIPRKDSLWMDFLGELSQLVLDILYFPILLGAGGEESMYPNFHKRECLNPLLTHQRYDFLFRMRLFPQWKEILLFQHILFLGLSRFTI
jgi:hypothetical protein